MHRLTEPLLADARYYSDNTENVNCGLIGQMEETLVSMECARAF